MVWFNIICTVSFIIYTLSTIDGIKRSKPGHTTGVRKFLNQWARTACDVTQATELVVVKKSELICYIFKIGIVKCIYNSKV